MKEKWCAALGWIFLGAIALAALPVSAGVSLSINSPSTLEGNSGTKGLPFTITRGPGDSRVILQYLTADGSATAPSDYVSLPKTVIVFPPGAGSAMVGVTVNGDFTIEDDESFYFQLQSVAAVGPDPAFSAPVSFDVGNVVNTHRPLSIAIGDVNGDGKFDLAVANNYFSSSDVAVLLNTTSPGAMSPEFSNASNVAFTNAPNYVALGDVNGDGRPDLVVAGTGADNGNVTILINTTPVGGTSPSFGSATSFLGLTGCGPASLGLGDINGDGKPDVVVGCSSNGTAVTLLNNTAPGASAASFSAAGTIVFTNFTVDNLRLGDFNGDGRPDLVLTNASGRLFVMLNTTAPGATSASYGPMLTVNLGPIPSSVAVGDVNGDGRQDIVVAFVQSASAGSPPPRVAVLLNTTAPGAATPGFSAPGVFETNGHAEFVNLGDFNGDGRLDLLVPTLLLDARLSVFLNTTPPGAGTPRFQDAGDAGMVGDWVMSSAAVDLNGDGRLDVALADYNLDWIFVLLNSTATTSDIPSFSPAETLATGSGPSAAVLGDLNGDGMPDIAVANRDGNSVSVLLGSSSAGAGVPGFTAGGVLAAGTAPRGIASADFNGDGRQDLAVVNAGSNNVSVLLNSSVIGDSTATFVAPTNFGAGSASRAVAAGDFNGDGKPDLVTANHDSNNVSILFNASAPGSSAAFEAGGSFAVGSGPAAVATGDFNCDGMLDVAVANATGNTVSVLLNRTALGSISAGFTAAASLATGAGPVSIATADVNGDGRLDLAVVNQGGNTVSLLFNTTAPGASTGSFNAAGSFATGAGPTGVVLKDVNNDGKPDLVVANGSGNSVSVLLNATAPGAAVARFTPAGDSATNSGPAAVVVGDVNGDSQNDLLVVNGGADSVSVLVNGMFTIDMVKSVGVGTILDDDADRVPDAFIFNDQQGAAPGVPVDSNSIAISGINAPTPVSVTGGQYSIDGGVFTDVDGAVSNGQSVRIRLIAAQAHSETTSATLTIGGVSATFRATTGARNQRGGGGALGALVVAAGLLLGLGARPRQR